MKILWLQFVKLLTSAAGIITALLTIVTLGLGAAGWLFKTICLPYWAVAVGLAAPFVVYKILEIALQSRRRSFKTGDLVMVLGDTRKFVVFGYYSWRPRCAKLKQYNDDLTIAISDKYLQAYIEPTTHDYLKALTNAITAGRKPPHGSVEITCL
jgi:hypothetical protein